MAGQEKVIAVNRKAFYDYAVLERLEAGLVLTGTEIKSIRSGRVNIREAYAAPEGGELWLLNVHIPPYPQGGIYNHEPTRPRKLLLHKDQIHHLVASMSEKRLTIVPLRLYVKGHVAKVELALVRGKRQYDKRQAIIEKEQEREARQAVRRAAR